MPAMATVCCAASVYASKGEWAAAVHPLAGECVLFLAAPRKCASDGGSFGERVSEGACGRAVVCSLVVRRCCGAVVGSCYVVQLRRYRVQGDWGPTDVEVLGGWWTAAAMPYHIGLSLAPDSHAHHAPDWYLKR